MSNKKTLLTKSSTKCVAKRRRSVAGFSLIEVLVSTTLLVFLLMTATTMFMTFLVSNAKTSVRHTLKGEGTAALSRMEQLIRNAQSVGASYCNDDQSNSSTFQVTEFNTGNSYTLKKHDSRDQIILESSAGTIEYLTSQTNTAENLQFTCFRSTNGSKRVELSFDLTVTAVTINATTPIQENFRTVVQIRN